MQLAETASTAPQLPPDALTKSPLIATPWIASGTPPLFVSMTLCTADRAPTAVAGSATDPLGESDTPAGATPVPLRDTVCDRNSSEITSTPCSEPWRFGTYETAIAHAECALSVVPHPFTAAKSPEAIWAPTSVNETSPAFVNVTCCVTLVLPITCSPKLSIVGANASVAGVVASPVKGTVIVAVSPGITRLPFLLPLVVGANTTAIVHPVPAASDAPHVLFSTRKSPEIVAPESVTGDPPVFETVTFCALLVPLTIVVAKLKESGVGTRFPGAVPFPISVAVAWPPLTFP